MRMWTGLVQAFISMILLVAVMTPARAQENNAREITVHVVAGETDKPLPGIALKMEWFPPEPPTGRKRPKATHTEMVHADAEGRVRVRAPAAPVMARFSDEELAGWVQLDTETVEVTLRLLPPHSLLLRVVDSNGRPVAGLPIRLKTPNRLRTRTDGTGNAVISDARTLAPPYEHPDLAAEIVLVETQHAPIRLPFQVTRLPHGPVTIEVPAAPPLSIRVTGANGPATVHLKGRSEWRSLDDLRNWSYSADVVDDVATFPWVPEGLELEVVALSADASRPSARTFVRSPAKGASLVIGSSRTYFTGRVVDASGLGLAGGYVGAHFIADRDGARVPAHAPRATPTGDDGAFRIEFDAVPARISRGTLHLTMSTIQPGGRSARVELEPIRVDVPRNETDLGALRADGGDIDLRGRIVDPDGLPVPDMRVFAYARDGERWLPVETWRAESDDDGVFELRGGPDVDELLVRCPDGRFYLPTPVVISPRDGEATLRVRPCGSISGTVRSDLRGAVQLVRVYGEPANDCLPTGWRGPEFKSAGIGRHGRFTVASLRPGRGRVEIVSGSVIVAEFDDIEVTEGEDTRDSRLQALEIPPHVDRPLSLRVVDADKRPLPRVRIRFLVKGVDGWAERETDADGRATISVGIHPPRVAVVRRGFATVMIDSLDADRTVTLRPTPVRQVPVHVRGLDLVRERQLDVTAQLRWFGPPGTLADVRPDLHDPRNFGLSRAVTVGADGRATLEAWEPGLYDVVIWVGKRNSGGRRSLPAKGTPRAIIAAEGRILDVVVDIDEAAVEDRLDALR